MKRYLIAAAVLLAITSCDKDKSENGKYKQEVSPVLDTELMNPGAADLSVQFKVTFIVFNGCGQFDSFVSSMQNDTLVMKVLARYPKEAFCTQDLPQRTATFVKKFPSPGRYYIKWVGPGQGGPESTVHRDTVVLK